MAKSKTQNFEQAGVDYDRLRTTLNNSRMQTENNALWQTVEGLISGTQKANNILQNQLSNILKILGDGTSFPANSLFGQGSSGSGRGQIITVGPGLEFQGTVLDVANQGDWDLILTKLNSQDVVNSATLENDNFLFFPVNEFDVWFVNLLLLYAGNNATGDYKFNFSLPTVNGWVRYIVDNDTSNAIQVSTGIRLAGATAFASSIACGTDAALTPRMAYLEMMIRAGADGNVQFQFANNAAASDRTSRTYAGSVLRAKLLSGIPIGQVDGIGGGGSNSGSGPGAGSAAPTVPFPNDLGIVQTYNAANPGQIEETEENSLFINGVVAALQGVSLRYGFNYKRGVNSGQGFSTDAISYYHGNGSLPPPDGDPNVYVIDIVGAAGTPSATPAWINVTTPAAAGGYHLGPI